MSNYTIAQLDVVRYQVGIQLEYREIEGLLNEIERMSVDETAKLLVEGLGDTRLTLRRGRMFDWLHTYYMSFGKSRSVIRDLFPDYTSKPLEVARALTKSNVHAAYALGLRVFLFRSDPREVGFEQELERVLRLSRHPGRTALTVMLFMRKFKGDLPILARFKRALKVLNGGLPPGF